MLEAKSTPCTTEFERLNTRVALFVNALLEESAPKSPPAPICNVPASTSVAPVKVFAPERISVPAPNCSNEPVPVIIGAKSVPCVSVLERLKMSVALLVSAPRLDREPLLPPLPISSVPALMVVAPV